MKIFPILLFSFLFTFTSYADTTRVQQKMPPINKTVGDSVNIKDTNATKRLDQSTANFQDERILWYERLIGILGVLATLIGVGIPLFLIFTFRQDIKEALNKLETFKTELEGSLDKKFEQFIQDAEHNKVLRALKELNSNQLDAIENATRFLSLTYFKFDANALEKIYNFLKQKRDIETREKLEPILFSTKSAISDKYFYEQTISPSPLNSRYRAMKYYSKYGIENYFEGIYNAFVLNTETSNQRKLELLFQDFERVPENNYQSIKKLCDFKKLIDLLTPEELQSIRDKKKADLERFAVDNTYYMTK